MNKQEMIEFEKEIGSIYNQGKIRGPIHLSGGNEDNVIEIFKNIKSNDWVFSSYRNHYHCLLKGMNPEKLKQEIIQGDSMHIMSKEHKIYTSSIVCSQIPIALGAALGIKLAGKQDRVYAFCGDMASEMGIFNECVKYANGHDLPISFIVEDNGLGVCTETAKAWGIRTGQCLEDNLNKDIKNKVIKYKYDKTYPHHGSGLWVNFPAEEALDPKYKDEAKKAMQLLAEDSKTIFLGQTVGCKGSPVYSSLEGICMEKRIETPIMEECQMGMSIGLALENYIPVSIYPRFDFLVSASNQLVNLLDKTQKLSNGDFNPKVIVRTIVGSKKPLDGGLQHTQNHSEAYKLLLPNMNVRELTNSKDFVNEYVSALNSDRSSLLIELGELYS